MTAEMIIEAPGGRQGVAKCPAHQDRSPSLSIREVNGKLLVHCFSGCDQLAVVEALRARGLWPEVDWTLAERRDFARQCARGEADLKRARLFADVARILTEQVLENLGPCDLQRAPLTALAAALRTEAGMLATFRDWRTAKSDRVRQGGQICNRPARVRAPGRVMLGARRMSEIVKIPCLSRTIQ